MRCLLFSSNGELVQPIWQVLADLGIEGEHCEKAVDAVKNVTSGSFQIVITDWENQPEAAFLLKTVRELRAALRPLTIAIVSDDAKRPQALQAGANSILLKPIRPEQLRETMSTACELLRSKLQMTGPGTSYQALAAAGAAGSGAETIVVSASVTHVPEKIRAGEFLQSSGSGPGTQVDTDPNTPQEPSVTDLKPVTEVEPMAAASKTSIAELKPQAMTGWAMLQARLTTVRPAFAAAAVTSSKSELLSYGQTPSSSGPTTRTPMAKAVESEKNVSREIAEPEAKDFAYISQEPWEKQETVVTARPKRGKLLAVAVLAAVSIGLVATPSTRPRMVVLYRNGVRAGNSWLNPAPAPLPQAVAVHDSFGQSGDEYDLPVPGNIPDATTDPSQIRVVPVIDPTAKPKKTEENTSSERSLAAEDTPVVQDQAVPNEGAQEPPEQHEVREAAPANSGDLPATSTEAHLDQATAKSEPTGSAALPVETRFPIRPSVPRVAAGIPSSLQSRIASSAPQVSGSKPVEAAMASIEPVKVPEPVEREFAIQTVDAVYPAATANGQKGTVVLQVLVGRDGSVQDAKFLQGSLLFARNAIDAARQYRFKPYLLNGRPVSVQSVLTLNFKPPA